MHDWSIRYDAFINFCNAHTWMWGIKKFWIKYNKKNCQQKQKRDENNLGCFLFSLRNSTEPICFLFNRGRDFRNVKLTSALSGACDVYLQQRSRICSLIWIHIFMMDIWCQTGIYFETRDSIPVYRSRHRFPKVLCHSGAYKIQSRFSLH